MIRQATVEDLERIAVVHIACFPESFSSSIGVSLLKRFYLEYMNDVPELFLVCENPDGQIVGFCMGYYMENNRYMKRFIRHNAVAIGLTCIPRLLAGDKRVWKKLFPSGKAVNWTIANHDFDDIPTEKQGDLLSVCILPDYRGNGYAQAMLEDFLNVLRGHDRSLCFLSVETDNRRGIRFYERNGFVLHRKSDDSTVSYRLVKDLR